MKPYTREMLNTLKKEHDISVKKEYIDRFVSCLYHNILGAAKKGATKYIYNIHTNHHGDPAVFLEYKDEVFLALKEVFPDIRIEFNKDLLFDWS